MKEEKYYTCKYCFNEFEPKRRRVQKYCCSNCKSKDFHARKKLKQATSPENKTENINDKTKIDKMSWAGVGNAASAVIIVELLMKALTKEENKAVTKGVLKKELSNWFGRYHKINDLPPKKNGSQPYFDMETKKIVYFGENNSNNEIDSLTA